MSASIAETIAEHETATAALFSSERIASVAAARGMAFQIGIAAVVLATADDPAERQARQAQLRTLVTAYVGRVRAAFPAEGWAGSDAKLADACRTARAFADRLEAWNDLDALDRPDAVALSDDVRMSVVPAINAIMGVMQARQDAQRLEHVDALEGRAAVLETMLTEMGRISRMIGLISVNASIEAARTGGSSGKAFSVIASEVHALAGRSAKLIAQTRASVMNRG